MIRQLKPAWPPLFVVEHMSKPTAYYLPVRYTLQSSLMPLCALRDSTSQTSVDLRLSELVL